MVTVKEIDYVGFILFTVGGLLLLLLLNWSGGQHPRASIKVIAPIVVSAV